VGFRAVFGVAGQPVRDRDERLARLFQLSGANAIGQGRRILDDGTRFNLNGDVGVRRTINMPFTALGFLTSRNQVRSRFQFERYEAAGGLRCVVIRFEEVATPRMLQSDNNAAAHGLVWIDPATGRILRTQLDFATSARLTITATFRVEYAVPPGLSLLLPVSLDERYDFAPGGGVITGHAEYSKFRQFKVDVGTNIK